MTDAGLKDVYKGFNLAGDELVARLRAFRRHGVHVLGSFIFGLPSDDKATFDATVDLADRADLTFAQFVLLTPFPGTIDFEKWAREDVNAQNKVDGVSITQHWLIPEDKRPKLFTPHPTMSLEEIRVRHAGRLGPVLQLAPHLGALARRRIAAGPRHVRAHLEAVPPDVREHGDRDRQRARRPIGALGAVDGRGLPPAVLRHPDARPGRAGTDSDQAELRVSGDARCRRSTGQASLRFPYSLPRFS